MGAVLKTRLDPLGASVDSTYYTHQKFSDSIQYDFFRDDVEKKFENKYDFIFLPTKLEFVEDGELLAEKLIHFLEYFTQSKVIYISSDGVFSGRKGLYKESDIPDPITLYGKNLLICEKLVTVTCQRYAIVRPSYIYGYSLRQLDARTEALLQEVREGKNVERLTDMYKSPLGVQQVAEAILKAGAREENLLIHVAGERLSVYEYSRDVLLALGQPIDLLIPSTIPPGKEGEMLPDTSLDNGLMKKILGIQPLSVEETFKE